MQVKKEKLKAHSNPTFLICLLAAISTTLSYRMINHRRLCVQTGKHHSKLLLLICLLATKKEKKISKINCTKTHWLLTSYQDMAGASLWNSFFHNVGGRQWKGGGGGRKISGAIWQRPAGVCLKASHCRSPCSCLHVTCACVSISTHNLFTIELVLHKYIDFAYAFIDPSSLSLLYN